MRMLCLTVLCRGIFLAMPRAVRAQAPILSQPFQVPFEFPGYGAATPTDRAVAYRSPRKGGKNRSVKPMIHSLNPERLAFRQVPGKFAGSARLKRSTRLNLGGSDLTKNSRETSPPICRRR